MDSETQARIARLERYSEEHQQRMDEIQHTNQKLDAIIALHQQSLRHHDQHLADLRATNQQIALALHAFSEHAQHVESQLDDLHHGQAHTDTRLDALIDIVQTKLG